MHSKCGWQSPLGWSPGPNEKEKAVSTSIPFSLLSGRRCDVARRLTPLLPYLPHHDAPYPHGVITANSSSLCCVVA